MREDLMPKDDLNAMRGILFAILISLPFWMAVILLLVLFGVIG
jgi:hypothetical protein